MNLAKLDGAMMVVYDEWHGTIWVWYGGRNIYNLNQKGEVLKGVTLNEEDSSDGESVASFVYNMIKENEQT